MALHTLKQAYTDQRELFGLLEAGADRAVGMVRQLLTFAKGDEDGPRVALQIGAVVNELERIVQSTFPKNIQLRVRAAPDLPAVSADPTQLHQVLLNFCVNARDAMPTGGRLTIETANIGLDARYVRGHPDATPGDYVMIVVTDTGTGMSPQVIERAFDPFYTTKGVGKGTGLGLSQVYGFARQSGGHVEIASEIGKGTHVQLYLPRHVGRGDSPRQAEPDALVPAARGEEIVLVVEDEPSVRHMSVDALRELGYTVVHASDAKQALSVLAIQPRIDLLFTDVVMPEMNGRELADAARALKPRLGIIYTTGYARDAVLQEGAPDPTIAVLPKPFTLSQLATKVRDVLDRLPAV